MTRMPLFSIALASLVAVAPAVAALKAGDKAPDFQAQASLGGSVSTFSLAASLQKGPVVLYFYPAAFTPGCTKEAHDFAEAVDQFKELGAMVIGVSHDGIDKLNQFSVSECRGKFAVLADPEQSIIKAYDVVWAAKPQLSSRTSYVITPDGRILYTYTDLNPDQHVANTLAALKQWKAQTSNRGATAPMSLKPPADQMQAFELQASGVQIYECRATKEDAAPFEWSFKAPQADLFDAAGKRVGTHYAGPTWEGLDGSKVVGEVKAKDTTQSAGSIPWLLLTAKSNSGEGLFGRVKSIQRLATTGGGAPAEAPVKAQAGQEVRVPYRAIYAFYVTVP
jgi:peroxiredoxin